MTTFRRAVALAAFGLLAAWLTAGGRAMAVKDVASPAPGDAVANWTWSGMVDYADPDLSTGHGHAGGPGSYAAYTFSGTGIDVYAEKCATVVVDQRAHKTGRVKISIDGKERDTVDLAAAEKDPHYKVAGITGLADGNHVLELEPVGGWIVIDSVKEITGPVIAAPGAAARVGDKHLVAYWAFDEGRGTSAADKSGHGHTGFLMAGAAWTPDAKVGTGAISFPSAGGVETNSPVINTTQSFTVSAWVKLANTDGYQTFVSIDGEKISGFYLQLRGDTHQFAFTMLHNDTTEAASTPTYAGANFAPQVGAWCHVVGAYDAPANMLALFVDGRLAATQSFTTPWQAFGHTAIGRGKYDGNFADFTNAEIDEVRIYDAALSPAAIMTLYDSGR